MRFDRGQRTTCQVAALLLFHKHLRHISRLWLTLCVCSALSTTCFTLCVLKGNPPQHQNNATRLEKTSLLWELWWQSFWLVAAMEKFLQIAPHSLALVLGRDNAQRGKAEEGEAQSLAVNLEHQRSGYDVFASFKAVNTQHFWNKALTHALSEVFFLGWIDPGTRAAHPGRGGSPAGAP